MWRYTIKINKLESSASWVDEWKQVRKIMQLKEYVDCAGYRYLEVNIPIANMSSELENKLVQVWKDTTVDSPRDTKYIPIDLKYSKDATGLVFVIKYIEREEL